MSEQLVPIDVFEGKQLDDLRLEMRIKSNVLWKAIHERYPSIAALCRAHEELTSQQARIGELLAFKISPFKKTSRKKGTSAKEYRNTCLLLVKFLNVPPEELFPEELYEKLVGTPTSKTVEISSFTALPPPERQKLLFLPAPDPSPISQAELQELKEKIEDVLKTLTYREKEIIKMRNGITDGKIYTLEELSEIFKVNRERIRQIEAKAMRKLKHTFRSNKLKSLL